MFWQITNIVLHLTKIVINIPNPSLAHLPRYSLYRSGIKKLNETYRYFSVFLIEEVFREIIEI